MAHEDQRDLFKWEWPPAEKYPLNNEQGKVRKWFQKDLKNSDEYLILAGFSSLEYLIEQFGQEEIWQNRDITIVLGNEPIIREEIIKKKLNQIKHSFSRHIADYWLDKGISIKLNGPLLSLIEAIEHGNISFKIHPKLHGKIYLGEDHLIMGSSNFSQSGMEYQAEINARFKKGQPEYKGLKEIAEYYLSNSKNYNDQLLDLLHQLLQLVTWEEALARAIAELLEGDWVDKYFSDLHPGQEFTLWPTQRQAIGQALYILDNKGSVLIAEPTGSGKTRVGAHLLAALLNRFWQQGRGNRSSYQIIAPPIVTDNWQKEVDDIYFTIASPISHGILSHQASNKSKAHLRDLKNATVLLIDEAHNYLNASSNRTQSIQNNKADHVILFTATPINRKWNDLLRMVELLGLDNLSDSAFKAYKKLKKLRRSAGSMPNPDVRDQLKKYSQKFIVRRTKREINKIIDKRPEAFTDNSGNRCRFPKHVCTTYDVEEQERDIELGEKIDQLSRDLKGVLYLKDIKMPKDQKARGVDPADFIKGRLKGVAALSRYNLKNCLRSSRAALIEHLEGTEAAVEWADIDTLSKTNSGNIISSLEEITHLPKIHDIDKKHFPKWLIDKEEYFETVEQEISLLNKISNCAKHMSSKREESKANFLAKLLDKHNHVLAFDSIVISHSVIKKFIKKQTSGDIQVIIATGGRNNSGKQKIQELFRPFSDSSAVIGLCTDALSEGVNLQGSSTVVFLDMPTVIRKAEQRAGRVDRLDSPHNRIDIYWPKDHNVFQLEVDKKFIRRHDLVDTVIGSNIKVPDEFQTGHKEKIDPELMGELYEERQEHDEEWTGVDDAFKPVRKFIGEDGLINEELYETYKAVSSNVISRVSIVKSDNSWGFFAIRGTEKRAPKWVLIKNKNSLSRDLPKICSFLQKKLPGCEDINARLPAADKYVADMVDRLNEKQVELLPNKRKLTLNIFEKLLDRWLKEEQKKDKPNKERTDIYKDFQHLFNNQFKVSGYSIDCYEFSQLLLDILHAYYKIAEEARKKGAKQYNSLRDLKRWLKDHPMKMEDLTFLWENIPTVEPLDKRIASAIIAIPNDNI